MDNATLPNPKTGEKRQIKRIGMVIGIKPDQIETYRRLHAGPGVSDLLRQAHIHNFSIFIRQLEDGRFYEFAYYEYTGEDYEADLDWLAEQPRNKEWLALCDPMQIPLSGETGWAVMESIYYNE